MNIEHSVRGLILCQVSKLYAEAAINDYSHDPYIYLVVR